MTATHLVADHVGPNPEPTERVNGWFIASLTAARAGLTSALLAGAVILLPRQVAVLGEPDKIANMATVLAVGGTVTLVGGLLAGALCDRTRTRFGRRHPWTLAGAAVAAGGFVAQAGAASLDAMIAARVVQGLGMAAMGAGLSGAIPDRVPRSQRGWVSAWVGTAESIALVAGVAATAALPLPAGWLLIAALILGTAVWFVAATPDAPITRGQVPAWSWWGFITRFWISPRRHPDFCWALQRRPSPVVPAAVRPVGAAQGLLRERRSPQPAPAPGRPKAREPHRGRTPRSVRRAWSSRLTVARTGRPRDRRRRSGARPGVVPDAAVRADHDAGPMVVRGVGGGSPSPRRRWPYCIWRGRVAGLVLVAVFPTNAPDEAPDLAAVVHCWAGAVVFSMAPVAGFLAARYVPPRRGRAPRAWSGVAGLAAAGFLLAHAPHVLAGAPPFPWLGLIERAAYAVLLAELVVLAAALRRSVPVVVAGGRSPGPVGPTTAVRP